LALSPLELLSYYFMVVATLLSWRHGIGRLARKEKKRMQKRRAKTKWAVLRFSTIRPRRDIVVRRDEGWWFSGLWPGGVQEKWATERLVGRRGHVVGPRRPHALLSAPFRGEIINVAVFEMRAGRAQSFGLSLDSRRMGAFDEFHQRTSLLTFHPFLFLFSLFSSNEFLVCQRHNWRAGQSG
jgi:hypothetical protein